MSLRYLLTRALQILALGALIGAIGLLNAYDRDVERLGLERYCEDVATWSAEAARGIDPYQRTGHPDWKGIADEQCPGMRPAGPALEVNHQRQLAQF